MEEYCSVMCEGLNANVHASQTGLFSPSLLSYPFKHEAVYWTTHLPTAVCGFERPWALCCFCTTCFRLVLLCPSLFLSYVHLTSTRWRAEWIYGGVLADNCWHTCGPLRNHWQWKQQSLCSEATHGQYQRWMSCLGTQSCLTMRTYTQGHILADYFHSGRNPPPVPEGTVAARPDGPAERELTVWLCPDLLSHTHFREHPHPHTGHGSVGEGSIIQLLLDQTCSVICGTAAFSAQYSVYVWNIVLRWPVCLHVTTSRCESKDILCYIH